MPMHLSAAYEGLFDELLALAADWRPRRGTVPDLTACWTACGNDYVPGKGLLVLGRATNGFEPSLAAAELASPAVRAEKLRAIRDMAERPWNGAPLCWVDGRGDANPTAARKRALGGTIGSRSAFWRVTRALLQEIVGELPATGWASRLAWGNLYKLAPNVVGRVSEGANPSGTLIEHQRPACVRLLRREVDEIDPRVVLVIAGEWWYGPFAKGLGLGLSSTGQRYVPHVCTERGGRVWIFTNRPEHKPQAEFVSGLASVYQSVSSFRD